MNENGQAKLVPIVVRPCDWKSSELQQFQAVPKDAKPITKWEDSDEAWLDVIDKIKDLITSFKQDIQTCSAESASKHILESSTVLKWIEDTKVPLAHRIVSNITLSDVYVSPDMEKEKSSNSDEIKIYSSNIIYENSSKYLIYGEGQQGKTSLLKHLFKKFLESKIVPIYLDAVEIKQADIIKSLAVVLKSQYGSLSPEEFLALPNKVLLIDNIDKIALNEKYRRNFLSTVNEKFTQVVVTSHTSFGFVSPEIREFDYYEGYELLGLGHIKRAEAVEKWVSLGVEESISEQELLSKCDEIKEKLDTIIRRNIVPPKPIYIYMLIQMFEAYTQHDLEKSSQGHCYQQLIYKAFDHADIPSTDIDKYLNVLTEFSWELYKNGGAINYHKVDIFFNEYKKIFLAVDGPEIIEKLKSNSILMDSGSEIKFKYPYLYYFFTAKKIAESYSTNPKIKKEVTNLVNNLHREDCANILIFINHHTKEAWVFEEIQKNMSMLFSEQKPATLSNNQLGFMREFIEQIPSLVMEQRSINEERLKHNKTLDEMERNDSEDDGTNDLLTNINKTFKGMEISGQIIRNRHATLTREAMLGLANNGVFAGLRFLDFFINLSENGKLEAVKHIEQKIKEHPNLSNKKVESSAKNTFLFVTYGAINGVVRKIASSIGSKEATEIYANIQKTEQSPALILLGQAIELHFNRNLNVSSVEKTVEKLKHNLVCIRILKEMVLQHTYMFPISYKEKQQLSELLKISVSGQRMADRKIIGKA